jgi:predicted ATPase/Tfp pilus assembly protein PilF
MKIILTPDQKIRVFVSSTLKELAPEREAAKEAITQMHMAPVMFELGARPPPAGDLYRAYLDQSDIFLGIYWQEYGWIVPNMTISGLEYEYNLSGGKEKLIYIKRPVTDIGPRLSALLSRIQNDVLSYKLFSTVDELRDLIANDLAHTLTERFEAPLVAPEPKEDPKAPTNNLPRQLTAFIGREKEVEAIRTLLRHPDTTLLTLRGPAGTGKTRLGLEAAGALLGDFSDGVWFVDLASIKDQRLVVPRIAQALGVKEAPGQLLLDTLKAYLKEKKLLLVLDNFEQVVEAAGEMSQLLAASALLKVLATSREPLRIKGEKEYAVSPLELPDTKHLPPLEHLTQNEAVRLFIARASDVEADFQVTNDNALAVAEICVRLDGLPLAIELAAARIRLFTPQALLARLSQRMKVLTGGAKNLPARQQTLRGAIEWSYDLLEEGEKQLFWRMAPFSGGRTFEALEGVCNYDGKLEIDLLEGIESLVSQSLLQKRQGPDGEPRFWMLETIHEYAREKLVESGEEEALKREHALYFMELAEEAEPHLAGAKQQEWLNRLEDEHDNLRYALKWAREQAEGGDALAPGTLEPVEIGLRTAGAMWRFWYVRGYFSEGREQLQGLLSATPTTSAVVRPSSSLDSKGKSKALAALGALAVRQGDYPAARFALEQARSRATEVGDKKSMALALNYLGNIFEAEGEYHTARSLYKQSLAIAREIRDESGIATTLNNLGDLSYAQGDHLAADSLYQESLSMRRKLEDKHGMATTLNNLGNLSFTQGDYPAARSLYEKCLAIQGEIGDRHGIATSFNNLGNLSYLERDYPAARSLYEKCLAIQREIGDRHGISITVSNLGNLFYMQGDYPTARSLYDESLAIQKEFEDEQGISASLHDIGDVSFKEGDHPTARSLYQKSLTIRREIGDKRSIAMSIARLGEVAAKMGEPQKGAELIGASQALMESVVPTTGPVSDDVASVSSQLGEEEFEKAWERGRAMSIEQVIAYALEEKEES